MDFAPAIFIGNSYRKQLFAPFRASRLFGVRPHLYIDSQKVLNGSKLSHAFYEVLLRSAHVIVISDEEGGKILEQYPNVRTMHVLWFCWNRANDISSWQLPSSTASPSLKICFLFLDETEKAREMLKIPVHYFKYPVLSRRSQSARGKYLISYIGEVDIVEKLGDEDSALNDYLWRLTEQFVNNGTFANGLKSIDCKIPFERSVWILKNRIRYRFVRALKEKYGDQFALVGDDWKRLGFSALPTNYDPSSRLDLYSCSRICLDLLSKSTLEAHYPRSAELVSYSNGILQLKTVDSEDFFGEQTSVRTFDSVKELMERVDYILEMSDQDWSRLGEELRTRLALLSANHNSKQLDPQPELGSYLSQSR